MSDASPKKRERIMMGMAGLAVLYLLISFLLPSGKQEAEQADSPPTNDMLTTISASLGNLKNKEEAKATEVLTLAAAPWENVAFSSEEDFAGVAAAGGDETAAVAVLSYTGFMVMGKGQLAIINGKDYQLGETVAGYVLKEITPDSVLLQQNGVDFRVSIQAVTE